MHNKEAQRDEILWIFNGGKMGGDAVVKLGAAGKRGDVVKQDGVVMQDGVVKRGSWTIVRSFPLKCCPHIACGYSIERWFRANTSLDGAIDPAR